MDVQEISERLHVTLGGGGFKWAIVSAAHAPELRQGIEIALRDGLINDTVYRQYSSYFDAMLKPDNAWARSIIVVSMPQPMLEFVFTIDGEKHPTILPPTYEYGIDEEVKALIERELKPFGYQIGPATLPRKLLATRSGLARYGKNNITYVEGFGSFHRLITFYTDLPAVADSWQEPQLLDECTGCNACTRKCRTGAIDPGRFRLYAERCLTLHNESSQAFPSWIDQSWHHCLFGCMRCQQCCPVNKSVWSWTTRFAEFSEEESALLLAGSARSELPQPLITRLDKTGLLEDPASFTRNLRSVLAASGQQQISPQE